MEIKLVKEPDNYADKEAIKVEVEGLGQVGYKDDATVIVSIERTAAGVRCIWLSVLCVKSACRLSICKE